MGSVALEFQTVLNNRKFKKIDIIKGVDVIERGKTLFNHFVEDALDCIYAERLLEDGKCYVCKTKTSMCCSLCGTHYCSIDCQSCDLLSHKLTCLGSEIVDENLRKRNMLEQVFVETIEKKNMCGDNGRTNKSFHKGDDSRLQKSSKHNSVHDISRMPIGHWLNADSDMESDMGSCVGDSTEESFKKSFENSRQMPHKTKPSNNWKSRGENSQIKKTVNNRDEDSDMDSSRGGSTKGRSESSKKSFAKSSGRPNPNRNWKRQQKSRCESSKSKENVKKFEGKKPTKNFVPGQKLQVKRTSNFGHRYWLLDKNSFETFEEIQNTLKREAYRYPEVAPVDNDLYAVKYNQEWHRCKVVSQEEKSLVRCVDIGRIFRPAQLKCRELPPHIKETDDLAWEAFFDDSVLPGEEIEWLNVEIMRWIPSGAYKVRLCDESREKEEERKKEEEKGKKVEEKGKKVEEEEIAVAGEGGKKRKKTKKKVVESESETTDQTKEEITDGLKRSIVDELKLSAKGVFIPGKIGKNELLGCLAPENIGEAFYAYDRINQLCLADGTKIDADVGQDVMVPGEDTTGRRGIVKSKSNGIYQVQLVDYGYMVEVSEVYQMPERMTDLMHLGCEVTLMENPHRRYEDFEIKRAYEFEVVDKKSNVEWLCKFATYPDLQDVYAFGIVSKPFKQRSQKKLNYVPLEDGCEVIITAVGTKNDVHVKRVSKIWEEKLEELNTKLNQGNLEPDVDIENVRIGEVLLCKYRQDELWYRAKVIHKKDDHVRVVFLDYGNFQISDQSELRSMPDNIDEPVFSRKVKLGKSSDTFSASGREFLCSIKSHNMTLVLQYTGKDLTDGVTLIGENGINVNKIAFLQESSSKTETSDSDVYDICPPPDNFNFGLVENLVLLHINESDFINNGIFWAADADNKNFRYAVSELANNLLRHCESTEKEEFSLEEEKLCIAEFQGCWYRGSIVKTLGSYALVFFIDFGDTQLLSSSKIRKMVPEFFKTPAIATKCVIHDFDIHNFEENQELYNMMSQNLNNTLKNRAMVVKVNGMKNHILIRDEQ